MISFAPLALLLAASSANAARQPYDVRKIVDAFRHPREDLTMLCAHRGLRWNGTADNSHDAYFRAAEAGIECIETDIRLSRDGYLPMIHDGGLGRETDVGEYTGQAAYNPYTGQGYNPPVAEHDYVGFMDQLHLRDEGGRVRGEKVPTLPSIVQEIHDLKLNVVLQLDFKDQDAVEVAYWQLKNLTNSAGVPANEWCIYKLQAKWHKTPEEFEALPWVQDAFASGIQLAYIPVYNPDDVEEWDTLAGLKGFLETNYTISAEIELKSTDGPLQELLDHVQNDATKCDAFRTAGTFFAIGDFVDPITSPRTFFDTANYTLPDDIRTNNSAFGFSDNKAPQLIDSNAGDYSVDGHDYRSDFSWIIDSGYNWVITDTPDEWSVRLGEQGKRNITTLLADGQEQANQTLASGWYKRHVRGFSRTN
ncbi:PLC-like phosphodiesterase [Aspergillus karnatakaensis]|uniref:PLC-like phosphodiesterase n=1 Tax=Aspergillus karnatakaensis TaxID=1810916 RepID=UPI003CCDBAD2